MRGGDADLKLNTGNCLNINTCKAKGCQVKFELRSNFAFALI